MLLEILLVLSKCTTWNMLHNYVVEVEFVSGYRLQDTGYRIQDTGYRI